MTLHCQITTVQIEERNDDEYRYILDESDIIPTDADTPGELYRIARSWHGRCISSIYVDTDKGTERVGWVFLKRDGDCLLESWITLHEAPRHTAYLTLGR